MGKYRKRPAVIEAFRWTGGPDQTEDPDWIKRQIKAGFVSFSGGNMFIKTLEGTMQASPGDYIIRGVQGEVHPCKPDIFEATYKPALNGGN
ncbi:hypothetical protein [Paenibacillus pinihumi]|uniref:hypothetical protein n=1 Tax=Paenibacillus pinihumi TaxID=669462 RepID=UPI0003F69F64|nr:hypothetical protein [Paenibacillus pinihumi]